MRAEIVIREANLQDTADLQLIVELSNAYAIDPMGLGEPLPMSVQENLSRALPNVRNALVLLAFEGEKAIGIATCFQGFSTFKAAPLINIHDIAVLPEARGKGVGAALLEAVKEKARERGCCKVTLEVREDNAARHLYERSGFEYGDPVMYFMTAELKDLSDPKT